MWFLLNIFYSQVEITTIKKNWGVFLLLCFAFLQFLNTSSWYSKYLDSIKQPNAMYRVEIIPAENSNGSICIREVKNNLGKINWANNSIFDLEITGEWKSNTNNCQFFINESKTGSIKFKNIGSFNDELNFILGTYPGAGQILIHTNTSHEKLMDLHSLIKYDQIKIEKLAPNYLIVFWNIINLVGWLAPIFILISSLYLILEKIGILTRINDFFVSIIVTLIYSAPLISHAYIGFYSRFTADDYSSASQAKTLGIIKSSVYTYMNWGGRFSANIFDSIMGFLGPKFTPFSTVTIIAIWVIVLISVIYPFNKIRSKNKKLFIEASLIAFMILFATFEATPNIGQSLYWGQGMRSVVPPLIIATIIVGIFNYYLKENELHQKYFYMSAFVSGLTFIAGGFSETYAAIQVFVFFTIFILGISIGSPYYKKKISKHITFGFLFSTLSMLIVIIAPGNKFRQECFPQTPGLFDLIWISANSMQDYFIRLLGSHQKLYVLFGLFITSMILGSGRVVGNPGYQKIYSFRFVKIFLLCILPISLSMIFVSFMPAAYGMSSGPPPRTLIIPTYILICAITAMGYFLGWFFIKNFLKKRVWRKLFVQLIFLLLSIIVIYSTINILDLQPIYSDFAEQWRQMDNMINKAKIEGKKTIAIPVVNNPFGLSRIGDTSSWVNKSASSYYGILIIPEDSLKLDTQ